MALIAFVVGIPLFFEVGVVILIPVVMFAARRAKVPVILLGIPALAGLSALHGLVPPAPRPADRHRRAAAPTSVSPSASACSSPSPV